MENLTCQILFFYEWDIGDFALTDSPTADIINSFPALADFDLSTGQINAYLVDVTGFSVVHFDA